MFLYRTQILPEDAGQPAAAAALGPKRVEQNYSNLCLFRTIVQRDADRSRRIVAHQVAVVERRRSPGADRHVRRTARPFPLSRLTTYSRPLCDMHEPHLKILHVSLIDSANLALLRDSVYVADNENVFIATERPLHVCSRVGEASSISAGRRSSRRNTCRHRRLPVEPLSHVM